MFTVDPASFRDAWADVPPDFGPATLRRALLVGTEGFGFSAESATDNAYMAAARIDPGRAAVQHAGVVRRLMDLGVPCDVLPGLPGLEDGIWPNNVVVTTPTRAVIGSMRHPVRRREAERADLRALVSRGRTLVDLSAGPVVEQTGVMVLDRTRGIAIIGGSSRVDIAGARAVHDALGLRLTLFTPLVAGEYHLNVVCASLAGRVWLVHPGSFADARAVDALAACAPVLALDDAEKASWAGNCLAITEDVTLFSATASLRSATVAGLADHGIRPAFVDVSELELGGGSLRCLIAELF